MALTIMAGCGAKPAATPAATAPKPAAPKTNAVVAVVNSNEFVSVFEDELLPPKGKDPFYPASTRRNPVVPVSTSLVHVDPVLVLKAVIRTSKHSQAVVNNSFMEVGEPPQSIRVLNSHVMARCLEIGDDYIIIQVEGEQPKRLQMEKKKL